jgi:hypothetical protein
LLVSTSERLLTPALKTNLSGVEEEYHEENNEWKGHCTVNDLRHDQRPCRFALADCDYRYSFGSASCRTSAQES